MAPYILSTEWRTWPDRLGGRDYVTASDAAKRASKKYDQEKIDRIAMRVPRGKKEIMQIHAEKMGESLNAFLNRAVQETMERDGERDWLSFMVGMIIVLSSWSVVFYSVKSWFGFWI